MDSEGAPIVLVPEFQPARKPEKKPFHLRKWHVVAIALVAIICLQAFLYVSLLMRYNSLDMVHQSLLTKQDALKGDYNSLQSDYDSLQSSYDDLQASYGSLQSDYDSLDASYDSLQSSLDYNNADYANLRDLINQRSLHLDIMEFMTPNDPDVGNAVLSVTGGWSNPSDMNEYWSDVKKMYDWVVDNVDYRYDGMYPVLPPTPSGTVEYDTEMWQFPSETLDLKKGDCEDMAILLASMILSYNDEQYAVECIWITGSLSAHVGVQFPVAGDKLTILDPAGNYFTQDAYGGLDSKDISTEINNWLNYWKPSIGNDVRVYRVFSNEIDRAFSSTSEYTSWMYNRY